MLIFNQLQEFYVSIYYISKLMLIFLITDFK